jgi:hypothetical protein
MSSKRRKYRGILSTSIPLNALAFGVAISGFFIPLMTQSPERLVNDAQSMLASSGATLTAAVPQNSYNSLAQELDAKEQSLNDREAALNELSTVQVRPSWGDIFGFVSFALSLILCALVGLNFYMDSARNRKRGVVSGKYSVDLS